LVHASARDLSRGLAAMVGCVGRLQVWVLVFLAGGMVAGCAVHDNFPMRNPETGQEVTCQSGEYWIEEGSPQVRIATQCIQACERHGFRRFTGNPYADAPHPKAPDSDVLPFIPSSCLP
jgi:hypothetical protein